MGLSRGLKQHGHLSAGDGGLIGDLSISGDLTIASAKALILQYGSGIIKLLCRNNSNILQLRNSPDTEYINLELLDLIAGNDPTVSLVDGVDVSDLSLGKKYVIGAGGPLLSHDAEATKSEDDTWTKAKTITLDVLLPSPVTLRVEFDMKTSNATSAPFARIYKNGVGFGTQQTTTSSTYETKSEDLSFAEGDTCELWYNTSISGVLDDVFVQNFRIYGSKDDVVDLDEAITRGDIETDPLQGSNS